MSNMDYPATTLGILEEMALFFDFAPTSPEKLLAYERELADIDPQQLGLVCRQLWRSLDRFPTLSQIRRAYFDLLFGPGAAAAAWSKVLSWTISGRRSNPTHSRTLRPEASDGFDALTLKAIAIMGWGHFWDGTEERYLRRDFLAAYDQGRNELADTFAREGMLGIEPSIGDGAVPALGGGR